MYGGGRSRVGRVGKGVGKRFRFKSAYLKGYVPEIKYVDTAMVNFQPGTTVGTAAPNTAAIQYLNLMVQGTGPTNRVGRKISMQTLQLDFFWTLTNAGAAPTGGDAPVFIRLAVVYDRNPNGNPPTLSDIWQARGGDAASTALTANAWTLPNRENVARFLILRDCKMYFPTNSIVASPLTAQILNNTYIEGSNCKMWVKLGGLEAGFKDSTAAIGSVAVGSLFIIGIASSDPTGAANERQPFTFIAPQARLVYSDV